MGAEPGSALILTGVSGSVWPDPMARQLGPVSGILGVPGTNTQPSATWGGGALVLSQESVGGAETSHLGLGPMPGAQEGLRLSVGGLCVPQEMVRWGSGVQVLWGCSCA